MPPCACSKRPRWRLCAPVNAPRSWPKSSDSSSSGGTAGVLTAMKGPFEHGLCSWRARATSSFPVPDSPVMSTVTVERESRPIARNTSCMAEAEPTIVAGARSLSGAPIAPDAPAAPPRALATARSATETTSSTSRGLARNSNAPSRYADTVLSRSEYAVIMMTGTSGWSSASFASNPNPSVPGIRTSQKSACGRPVRRAARTASPDSKVRTPRPARTSAFSSTNRIERSSSTTQISSRAGAFMRAAPRAAAGWRTSSPPPRARAR